MGKELKMALAKLHSFSIAAKHIKELKIGSSRLQGEKLYKPPNPTFPYGEKTMSKEYLISEIMNILKSLEEDELEKVLKYIKDLSKNQSKKKYKLSKETVRRIIKERVCPVCKEKYVDFSYDTKKKQFYVIHYRPQTRYCYISSEFINEIVEVSKELKIQEFVPMSLPAILHSIVSGYNHEKRDLDPKINSLLRKWISKYRDLQKIGKISNKVYEKLIELTKHHYGRGYIYGYAVNLDFDLYLEMIKLESLLWDKGIYLRIPHLIIPVICCYIDEFHTKKYSHLISLIKSHVNPIYKSV